jgi:hypothetical protein
MGNRRRTPSLVPSGSPVKRPLAPRCCVAAKTLENDNVVIYIEAHGDDLMSRLFRKKKMFSLIVLTVSAIRAQRAAA